jgi:hypothetical protein
MIWYLNILDSTKNLLYLINTFGKEAGYKIYLEKWLASLYFNSEQAEKEIWKQFPSQNSFKKFS